MVREKMGERLCPMANRSGRIRGGSGIVPVAGKTHLVENCGLTYWADGYAEKSRFSPMSETTSIASSEIR